MIKHLLRHQWYQFTRSGSFGRELGLTILIIILAIIVLASLISLSFALPFIIEDLPAAADNPFLFFNKALIYYFFLELFLRYFLQKIPVMDVEPYLNLPITRGKIAGFLLGKSLLSVFNLISLILVVPFAVSIVSPEYGTFPAIAWVASIFFTSIIIHFFNILFKKKLENMIWVWILILGIAGGNYLLSLYTSFDFLAPLANALIATIEIPVLLLIPLIASIVLYIINYKFITQNLYLEEIGEKSNDNVENYSDRLSFLGNSGISGAIILQEIKMIFRHKRTRSVLFLSIFFLAYGLMFFGRDEYQDSKGLFVFVGIFMSGLFSINYGQFLWSWNTNQMDFFFTRPLGIETWIKARYKLVMSSVVLATILSIPYVYFGWEALAVILAGSLYNAGINIPLMMRLSLWGPKPIDLNKGAFMNYQGTGAAQWVMGLPLFLGPFVFYTPTYYLLGHNEGVIAVAVAGILGYIFKDYFLKKIAQKLSEEKYRLIHQLTL
ncbi:hypothetical protein JKA74_16245 [Marivirga sp. S37H4]|uniref:Uncharacterized protein n=1 Tax=Marivirga aurantiaca TaxID=2802615 RepID=A0A934X165_9BACT|nr:DUF5687 family protein [Marivirga aurantiaca]MBK6266597.1 hypothetical protein [Marivirga aurantiaca]